MKVGEGVKTIIPSIFPLAMPKSWSGGTGGIVAFGPDPAIFPFIFSTDDYHHDLHTFYQMATVTWNKKGTAGWTKNVPKIWNMSDPGWVSD